MLRTLLTCGLLIGPLSAADYTPSFVGFARHPYYLNTTFKDAGMGFSGDAARQTFFIELAARIAALEHVLIEGKICRHDDLRHARAFVDLRRGGA